MRALHDLQPSPDVSEALPREDERASAETLATRAENEIAPKLRPPEADNLRRRFEEHLSTPRDVSLRPSVLHADLSRDHILMQDEAVVAVIDFGDVNWGDADYDFTYLFVECGLPFVEEVARRYEHPNLNRLRFKLNYFAMADEVDVILNGPGSRVGIRAQPPQGGPPPQGGGRGGALPATIDLATAQTIVTSAQAAATAANARVAVAVVDSNGDLVVLERMDGSGGRGVTSA